MGCVHEAMATRSSSEAESSTSVADISVGGSEGGGSEGGGAPGGSTRELNLHDSSIPDDSHDISIGTENKRDEQFSSRGSLLDIH